MSDRPSQQLSAKLQASEQHSVLVIADENTLSSIDRLTSASKQLSAISNRYDVAKRLCGANIDCAFNDFDFSHISDHSLDGIYYRISKEKPVVHHIINAAQKKLKQGGQLIFCGFKSDGTKSYFDKAKKAFGGDGSLKKDGDNYTATLTLTNQDYSPLDDKSYSELRPAITLAGQTFQSKPGLFGWNKVDQGSQLLINVLLKKATDSNLKPSSLLDLGCGYGYLTLASAFLNVDTRYATDNNAAAVHTAAINFQQAGLTVETIAADCGSSINQTFDLILCNPPFHQGFSVDGDLTDKFLSNIKRLLGKNGTALLVVNQFLPIERKAKTQGFNATPLENDGSFKVVSLSTK